MILIGLGSNLETERYGPREGGLEAALEALSDQGVRTIRRSRWYESAPVPASSQPWFVNGVALVETRLAPRDLMAMLLRLEQSFGRAKRGLLVPRVLDLDLLDYDGRIERAEADAHGPALVLPHPRMSQRAFVLVPLAEIAPEWRHPVSGLSAAELLEALDQEQPIAPLSASRPCIEPKRAY